MKKLSLGIVVIFLTLVFPLLAQEVDITNMLKPPPPLQDAPRGSLELTGTCTLPTGETYKHGQEGYDACVEKLARERQQNSPKSEAGVSTSGEL